MKGNVTNEIVRVKALKHIYPDQTEVSVGGLDFVIHARERIAILGPNGAGKTTLLNHILGILKPVEGEVNVFGYDPSKDQRAVVKNIGVLLQNVDEQIIGPTVYDDIAFTPRNYGYPKAEIQQMIDEISTRIGINHLLAKIPHYLSGGQKKKVALAGAMVLRPRLLVLDEPFNGLDPKAKEEIIQLLQEINTHYGTALLMTSHEINYLPQIVDQVYILSSGQILRYGTTGEILRDRDFLQQVALRPPILVELFTKLRARGIELSIPLDIEQAEAELSKIFTINCPLFRSELYQKNKTTKTR